MTPTAGLPDERSIALPGELEAPGGDTGTSEAPATAGTLTTEADRPPPLPADAVTGDLEPLLPPPLPPPAPPLPLLPAETRPPAVDRGLVRRTRRMLQELLLLFKWVEPVAALELKGAVELCLECNENKNAALLLSDRLKMT